MRKTLLFLILIGAGLVFAQAQKVENRQNKTEIELTSIVKRMFEAQKNYDAVALDKIFASDFIEISPVGEFDPREKVLSFYKPEMKPSSDEQSVSTETDEYSVRTYKDFAVVITRITFTRTVQGKTASPFRMRVTLVFRKENGAWKIASAQYTGIRPAPNQPPRAT